MKKKCAADNIGKENLVPTNVPGGAGGAQAVVATKETKAASTDDVASLTQLLETKGLSPCDFKIQTAPKAAADAVDYDKNAGMGDEPIANTSGLGSRLLSVAPSQIVGRESPRSVVDRITDDTSESSEEEHSLSARLVAAEQHINMLQCMLAQRDNIIMQQSAVMWHQQQHVAALQHQAAHVHFGANQMHAQLMRERQYYAWVMHASNRNADPIGDTEAPASPIVEETATAQLDSERKESQRATLEEVPEFERETPHHASAEATPATPSTAAEADTAAAEPEVMNEKATPLAHAHGQEACIDTVFPRLSRIDAPGESQAPAAAAAKNRMMASRRSKKKKKKMKDNNPELSAELVNLFYTNTV